MMSNELKLLLRIVQLKMNEERMFLKDNDPSEEVRNPEMQRMFHDSSRGALRGLRYVETVIKGLE